MLWQLLHEFTDGRENQMIAQSEAYCSTQMCKWVDEICPAHPLPEGAQWLMCNETSEHFVLGIAIDENTDDPSQMP